MKTQLSILSTRNVCHFRFDNKHKNGDDGSANGDDENGSGCDDVGSGFVNASCAVLSLILQCPPRQTENDILYTHTHEHLRIQKELKTVPSI